MSLLRCLCLIVAICFLGTVSSAQEKVAVLADQITFDQSSGVLVAKGNVKVFYLDQTLRTDEIRYNQRTGQIEIPGPLTITQADGLVVVADSADLSDDLRKGLVTGARVLIDQQLQLASSELVAQDDRYNVLTKVIGTTCNICPEQEVPFWQIRAERVVHDKLERRLYFEGATLRLGRAPVLYFPNLSVPEPGVTRATGFLVPEFSQSNLLGYGVRLPYFLVLGDHADATLTPALYTKESFVLGAEYRRRFRTGSLRFNGAIALADGLSDRNFRSYVEGAGKFNLPRNYTLTFGVHLASDRNFKTQYDFGDEDRLKNFVTVDRTRDQSYVSLGASLTQSLRVNEIDQEIPVVLPEFYSRVTPDQSVFGGRIGYTTHATALLRDDELWLRSGVGLDWSRTWTSREGLQVTSSLSAMTNGYVLQNYTNYSSGQSFGNTSAFELSGNAKIDVRYPLVKQSGSVTHYIAPILQLVASPDRISTAPNEDSVQAEFEETNLFSDSRFPGIDRQEAGTFANVGINYLRYHPSGWELEATAGRVFRSQSLDQFPTTVASGLDGRVSDYVGSLRIQFPNQFEFATRALFDSKMNVSKNETQMALRSGKFDGYARYVWLEQNIVLNSNKSQHEINFGGSYKASDHWIYSADWRHNLESGDPIEGRLGVQYQNECAKVNMSVNLEYDEFGNETREFRLKLGLEGLGSRENKKRLAHRCSL